MEEKVKSVAKKLAEVLSLARVVYDEHHVPSVEATRKELTELRRVIEKAWNRQLGHTIVPTDRDWWGSVIKKEIEKTFGKDAKVFYLGTYSRQWYDAINSKKPINYDLDAAKTFLASKVRIDPYRGLRLGRKVPKGGFHDVYERGLWPFYHDRDTVFVTFEFTPCLVSPLLCMALSAFRGKGMVFLYDPLEFARSMRALFKLARKGILSVRINYYESNIASRRFGKPYLSVITVTSEENPYLRKTGEILHYVLTSNPLGRKDHIEQVLRFYLKRLDRRTAEKVVEILDHIY